MTGFAEMSGTPAEPLGHGAAKFTFEFNIVSSMFSTVLNTCPNTHSRTFTTDQLLWLELSSLLSRFAILHTTKVRTLALEAHVVGELVDGVCSQIIEESVSGVLESLMLVYALKLGSLHDLLQHIVLDPLGLGQLFHQSRTVGRIYPLLALRTLQVTEDYSRTRPPLLDLLQNTVQMEYVIAG